jgi:hypothetical protein
MGGRRRDTQAGNGLCCAAELRNQSRITRTITRNGMRTRPVWNSGGRPVVRIHFHTVRISVDCRSADWFVEGRRGWCSSDQAAGRHCAHSRSKDSTRAGHAQSGRVHARPALCDTAQPDFDNAWRVGRNRACLLSVCCLVLVCSVQISSQRLGRSGRHGGAGFIGLS